MRLTNDNYFSLEASREYFSVSQYKTFLDCPARAMAEIRGEYKQPMTTALLVGSYVDAYFEGTLDKFREEHPEIFKKDGSLKADCVQAETIIERIEADELFMEHMSGKKQVNLDIQIIEHWMDKTSDGKTQVNFTKQFEDAVASQKYDNIIIDNVSDLFDMAILEMDDSGRYKDMRQAYQLVYQNLKRLVRTAGQVDCNVIFTAWHETSEITLPDGQKTIRVSPKLPMKILDNFLGLCNIVGYINTHEKNGEKRWYYMLEGSQTLYAKDQLHCRKTCLPEDIFCGKE